MGKKDTENLLKLRDVDGQIQRLSVEKKQILGEREQLGSELHTSRKRVTELEAAHKDGRLQQVMEEHRLRDEQEKIINRRKQLSALGGVKAAKLVEREIDVAARTLQQMEERAIKALEEVDQLENQLQGMRKSLEQLELNFENRNKEIEERVLELDKSLNSLQSQREKFVSQIEERLVRLYNRVRGRHPGDAVAVAKEGACLSCHRALPSQTFNQILAGSTLIQCPGCSRIMIAADESAEDSAADSK